MNRAELIDALREREDRLYGSSACMGCGREQRCSLKGCAIIRKAISELERYQEIEDWLQEKIGQADERQRR